MAVNIAARYARTLAEQIKQNLPDAYGIVTLTDSDTVQGSFSAPGLYCEIIVREFYTSGFSTSGRPTLRLWVDPTLSAGTPSPTNPGFKLLSSYLQYTPDGPPLLHAIPGDICAALVELYLLIRGRNSAQQAGAVFNNELEGHITLNAWGTFTAGTYGVLPISVTTYDRRAAVWVHYVDGLNDLQASLRVLCKPYDTFGDRFNAAIIAKAEALRRAEQAFQIIRPPEIPVEGRTLERFG